MAQRERRGQGQSTEIYCRNGKTNKIQKLQENYINNEKEGKNEKKVANSRLGKVEKMHRGGRQNKEVWCRGG